MKIIFEISALITLFLLVILVAESVHTIFVHNNVDFLIQIFIAWVISFLITVVQYKALK